MCSSGPDPQVSEAVEAPVTEASRGQGARGWICQSMRQSRLRRREGLRGQLRAGSASSDLAQPLEEEMATVVARSAPTVAGSSCGGGGVQPRSRPGPVWAFDFFLFLFSLFDLSSRDPTASVKVN